MARNAYIRVDGYSEGVLFITTPSERQLHCTRSAPDRPTTSRWSPDEARQPVPGREPIHIGRADSNGAQSGRRIG